MKPENKDYRDDLLAFSQSHNLITTLMTVAMMFGVIGFLILWVWMERRNHPLQTIPLVLFFVCLPAMGAIFDEKAKGAVGKFQFNLYKISVRYVQAVGFLSMALIGLVSCILVYDSWTTLDPISKKIAPFITAVLLLVIWLFIGVYRTLSDHGRMIQELITERDIERSRKSYSKLGKDQITP